MNQNSPIDRLQRTQPGDIISARRLTRTTEAITRMNAGVAPPQHIINKPIPTKTPGAEFDPNITHVADAAATANLTLSGEQTVDGLALTDGMFCLARVQTLPGDRDLYIVRTGAWERLGTLAAPARSVHTCGGATLRRLLYTLNVGTTTYQAI